MNKPKIVCVQIFNDYSGTPLILSEVIHGLVNRGYGIDLYTSGKKDEGFLSQINNINTVNIKFKWRNNFLVKRFFLFINQLIMVFYLFKYRRQNVVFYINTMMPYGVALIGRLLRKKVISHLHESSIKPLKFKRFLVNVINKNASDVIYVSKYLKDKNPVIKPNSYVIHNALSPDFINSMIEKEDSDDFTVLMLCSLQKYKGIHEFIQLAARLSDAKFELVISASDIDVNAYFKSIRFTDNLQLFSMQKNVHNFFSHASLVLNLSHTNKWIESFGLTILEAMQYGIPAIVPPNGGICELITDGINGYKINVKELDKITDIIFKIKEDKALYNELSKNALLTAKKFNYKKMIDEIENVIIG